MTCWPFCLPRTREVESASLKASCLRRGRGVALGDISDTTAKCTGHGCRVAKMTYVYYNHVDFISDDCGWLSECRNFRKRKVRHFAPLPLQLILQSPVALGVSLCSRGRAHNFDTISMYLPGTGTCQTLGKVPDSKLFRLHEEKQYIPW